MATIGEMGLVRFLEFLLPSIVEAGRFTEKIQLQIAQNETPSIEQKTGGGRFGSALTDADVLVESFLGMILYLHFTDVAFYGEERDKDRISAYFPASTDVPYTITLDPVNATLFYKDGHPYYDIVLSVCQQGRIVAAVDYVPSSGVFYIAIRDQGAFSFKETSLARSFWPIFHTADLENDDPGSPEIVLAPTDPALIEKLEQAGFKVVTKRMYDGSNPSWQFMSRGLLSGDLVAVIMERAQLIDAGAVSFITTEAGGLDNDPAYDPETLRTQQLVTAVSPEIYFRIVAAIRDRER